MRGRSRATPIALLCSLALLAPTAGCLSTGAIDLPLAKADPDYGYRPSIAAARRDRGEVFIYLAFSGGGTRAAALAYGVMQALHETQLGEVGGADAEPRTLLDEVDTISGVSGGSFPAAYYGLFGDRIFEDFEARFLRRNIQGAIFGRALLPWNLLRLLTPWLSRSDIAKDIYHTTIFDRASFRTLTEARGPLIYINATDLASGNRLTFSQGQFDLLCTDLQALPIAYAVAASSAVPLLLSPISIRSHAGTCGVEPYPWLDDALADPRGQPRRYRAARAFLDFRDPEKRFLHLVDGAISDNLGLRAGIELVEAAGSLERAEQVTGSGPIQRLVVVSVNAETDPDPTINLSAAAPGFASLMGAVSGGQIRRFNFETLMLTHELLRRAAREAADRGRPMETFLIEVDLANLPDEEDRRAFRRIPTSFRLSDRRVDELIWAGRELLLEEPAYQRLVRSIDGTPAERTPRPTTESALKRAVPGRR